MNEHVKPKADARNPRLAYSVEEALSLLPFGRNKFYEEAKSGRLKVRKCGRVTLVLADELREYLQSLPLIALGGEQA